MDNVPSELDTHADTICAGQNCRLIHYTGQECTVSGFHHQLGTMEKIPIATMATAWSDEHTGQGFILIMHETLFFGNDLDHSLINPNQICHNGFQVYDNPYEVDQTRQMGIVISDDERIPFQSAGTTIYFHLRYPTDFEMDTFTHVVLTSEMPWDPSDTIMPGGAARDRFVQKVQSLAFHGSNRHHKIYETDSVTYATFGDTEQLQLERIIQSVNVDTPSRMDSISELYSLTRHSQFTPEHVAKIWNVGVGTAKDILATTTQKGVRHAVLPLSRRYRIDHLNLHANYLGGKWTLDHVESKYRSIRGHTGSFVISNGNLAAVYPQATKGDADATDSLRRFCDKIGVPAHLKVDMAASFTGRHTDFQRAINKYGIKLTFAEPYRHNQLQQVDVERRHP